MLLGVLIRHAPYGSIPRLRRKRVCHSPSGTGLATEASGTRWQFVASSSWYAQHGFNGDFSQPVLINADSVNTDQEQSEIDSLSQPSQLWILPQGLLFAFMNERKTATETLSSPYPLFLRNPAKQALSPGLAGVGVCRATGAYGFLRR